MNLAATFRTVLAQPSGAIGVVLVVFHLLLALLSPLLVPHDPTLQNADLILQPPGWTAICCRAACSAAAKPC